MRTGYVYILHFDTPLAHAQHYVGCTFELCGRLTQHASGRGSRLTRELVARGIEWRLGALFAVNTIAGLRRAERQVKDQHNTARYCNLCRGAEAQRFPGTMPYPIEAIPFGTTSTQLRTPLLPITVRFSTADESPLTMMDISKMMQAEKDRVGFIPIGGEHGMIRYARRGNLVVAQYEGTTHVVGYLYWSATVAETHVHQAIVADALRGTGIGRRMIRFLAEAHPAKGMSARVRDDLNAVGFWERMGFAVARTERHATSGSTIRVYERPPQDMIDAETSELPD